MKILKQCIGLIGLTLTGLPAFLVFFDVIGLDVCKWLMLAGTILWFGSRGMGRPSQDLNP
ncbi:MAG: hypothetical protein AAF206_02090 [Bacteroidota bacterium]